jgi:pilus assembly protein Flp/PilA
MKDLLKRLLVEEEGQGITEYALILGLVVFGIWVAIRATDLGTTIAQLFTNVKTEVSNCSGPGCGTGGGAPE